MDIRSRMDEEHQAVFDMLPEGLLDLSDIQRARDGLDALAEAMPVPELPDTVTLADHLVPGFDGHEVLVRTYVPDAKADASAALYWIHGGGMVLGEVAMDDAKCAGIAQELNIVVASVDYRLAPEHPYPAPMEDCYSGLTWFFSQAEAMGLDSARIAIGGGSAGGGLAAGLALLARDRGEVAPCFQLLTFPMLDDRNATPSSHAIDDFRVWNRPANLAGWNAYLSGNAGGDDVPVYAAPARATDLSGLPPAIVTVGDLDMFLDEDIAYAQALLQAGVPTELHVYPGAFHGSNVFIPDADLSQRWQRDEHAALARSLAG